MITKTLQTAPHKQQRRSSQHNSSPTTAGSAQQLPPQSVLINATSQDHHQDQQRPAAAAPAAAGGRWGVTGGVTLPADLNARANAAALNDHKPATGKAGGCLPFGLVG